MIEVLDQLKIIEELNQFQVRMLILVWILK